LGSSNFTAIKDSPKSAYHFILTGSFIHTDDAETLISNEQFISEYAQVEQVVTPQADSEKLKVDAQVLLMQYQHSQPTQLADNN